MRRALIVGAAAFVVISLLLKGSFDVKLPLQLSWGSNESEWGIELSPYISFGIVFAIHRPSIEEEESCIEEEEYSVEEEE